MQEEHNAEASPEEQEALEATEVSLEELSPEAVQEIVRERDQFHSLAQRIQADFVNYKHRIEEERQDLLRSASSQMLQRLLPVMDDFHLAMDHLPDEADTPWADGTRMVVRKLQALLEQEGVTDLVPEPGTPLDPIEHDALYYEHADEYPPGTIVQVVRRGYRLHDKVLRPAQVTLAQSQESETGAK